MNKIIHKWHSYLDMPKYDLAWHQQDLADELGELNKARGFINVWSELSDVAYTYTRAYWAGHSQIVLPISYPSYYLGLIYMFPKFTLRWKFFDSLGKEFGDNVKIREVRNPKKIEKLMVLADKYQIDKDQFIESANKKMKYRFFLK